MTIQATKHAEERALERMKLASSQLEEMLKAGACVRVWRVGGNSKCEGWLLWSPVDQLHCLAWVEPISGNIVTCMPFSYSEEHFVSLRGEDVVINAKSRAKKMATQWLLSTMTDAEKEERKKRQAALQALEQLAALQSAAEEEEPKSVDAYEKFRHLSLTLHTSRRGRKVQIPLEMLDLQFLERFEIRCQREVYVFVQALLSADWFPALAKSTLLVNGITLEELVEVSAQIKDGYGSTRRMVRDSTDWQTCVFDDSAHCAHPRYRQVAIEDVFELPLFSIAASLAAEQLAALQLP